MGRRRLTSTLGISGLNRVENGAMFVLHKLGQTLAGTVGAGLSDQVPDSVFQKRAEGNEQVIAGRLQNFGVKGHVLFDGLC